MLNKQIGDLGEKVACVYLIKKGYKVLNHNWFCHWGEIDIIAEKNLSLVFVEVKTRETMGKVEINQVLNYYKNKALSRVSKYYILRHPIYYTYNLRWDLILVTYDSMDFVSHTPKNLKLHHFKDVPIY